MARMESDEHCVAPVLLFTIILPFFCFSKAMFNSQRMQLKVTVLFYIPLWAV